MTRKLSHRWILGLLGFAALAGAGTWFYFHPYYWIDANAERPWAEEVWKKKVESSSPMPLLAGTAEDYFRKLSLQLTSEPGSEPYGRLYAGNPIVDQGYEQLPPGDPRMPLKLSAFGLSGYLFGAQKRQAAPVHFFDASGQPLAIPPRSSVFEESPEAFAPLQLETHFDEVQPTEIHRVSFFDRRTHVMLSRIHGYDPRTQGPGFQAFGAAVYTLRPTGVLAVLDVAVRGDTVAGKLDPSMGARLTTEDFALKVIAVVPEAALTTTDTLNINVDTGAETYEIRHSWWTKNPSQTWTTFLIGTYPVGDLSELTLVAIDRQGREFPMETRGVRDGYLAVTTLPLDAISHLEVRGPAQFYRLVYELPPLPGLPPENDRVRNLMDLKIPRLYLRPDDIGEVWGSYAQLEIRGGFTHDISWSWDDQLLENITLHDLSQQALESDGDRRWIVSRDMKLDDDDFWPPRWIRRLGWFD